MSYKNILILTSEFPPQPGGIGNHSYNLADNLSKKGYNISILTDRRTRISKNEELIFDENLNYPVYRIDRSKIIFFTYLRRIFLSLKYASGSEIIICSGKFPLWLGGFSSLFFRKKIIAVIHGSELLLTNIFLRKLTNFSLTRFDNVIAVSNYTKGLVSHLNINNLKVIYNGFNIEKDLFSIKQISEKPILITIGNMTERKGQHNVIKALPEILRKYPDLQYHIVGLPTDKSKLIRLARDLKVLNSIFFYENIDNIEKIKLLRNADIFIMLSQRTDEGDVEGFGIASIEANSLGLPSIGAKNSGLEEAICSGYSGVTVEPAEHQEIVKSIDEILSDYCRFSQNAKKWSNNFRWERIIDQYITILKN